MAQVVKCSRILPRYCTQQLGRVAYLNTATTKFQESNHKGSRSWNGVGLVAGVGLLFLGNMSALAKEEEVGEEERVSAAIAGSVEDLDTDFDRDAEGKDIYDQWVNVQEKYLLLHETKRKSIEMRDITAEDLAEVDALYDAEHITEMEDKLIELNTVCPHNCEVLWRLARLKWVNGRTFQNNHSHKTFHLAHTLALNAIEANPSSGDAHRWAAILGHHRAMQDGGRAQLYNLEAMKYHLERAVELNPNDHQAWTILGNWHFEVAEITGLQRVYSKHWCQVEPPTSSYETAMECFRRSDSIESWNQNTLFMAITQLRMGRREHALEEFKRLYARHIVTMEDYRIMKLAHIFILKLTDPSTMDKIKDMTVGRQIEGYRLPIFWHNTRSSYYNDTPGERYAHYFSKY